MRFLLLTAVAAMAMTGVARADIDETVTGTISYAVGYAYDSTNGTYDISVGSNDATGLFGGVNMTGQAFDLTITGNLAGLPSSTGNGSSIGESSTTSPAISNSITINGDTYSPAPVQYSESALYNATYWGSAYNEYDEYTDTASYNYVTFSAHNFSRMASRT